MHSTRRGQCQRAAIVHAGSLAWLTGAPKWSRATSNVISYTWQANCLLCERERSLLAAPIRAVFWNSASAIQSGGVLRHKGVWAGVTADGVSSECQGMKEKVAVQISSSQSLHMLNAIHVTYISLVHQEWSPLPGHIDTTGWKRVWPDTNI